MVLKSINSSTSAPHAALSLSWGRITSTCGKVNRAFGSRPVAGQHTDIYRDKGCSPHCQHAKMPGCSLIRNNFSSPWETRTEISSSFNEVTACCLFLLWGRQTKLETIIFSVWSTQKTHMKLKQVHVPRSAFCQWLRWVLCAQWELRLTPARTARQAWGSLDNPLTLVSGFRSACGSQCFLLAVHRPTYLVVFGCSVCWEMGSNFCAAKPF